jgi:hypothetical protein
MLDYEIIIMFLILYLISYYSRFQTFNFIKKTIKTEKQLIEEETQRELIKKMIIDKKNKIRY